MKQKEYMVIAESEEERFSVHCKTESKARKLAYEYKMSGYHTQIITIKLKGEKHE